jgi:Protein of unknown function (DUF2971)
MNMPREVAETYESLWHYTTGAGLLGIIESKQLWATNIDFLNDAEEFSGFFDRKFKRLVGDGVSLGLSQCLGTEAGRDRIAMGGGLDLVQANVTGTLHNAIRTTTLRLNAFVVSLCHTALGPASDQGLLSQWRGYGPDGGYAIVFDADGLKNLLETESRTYHHAFVQWGDVDYHEESAERGDAHDESREWEERVVSTVAALTRAWKTEHTEELFEPVLCLATRHKHGGFREEREVRVALLASEPEHVEASRSQGDLRPQKVVRFAARGGLLVPYVALFERPDGSKATLPIRKVIIGPHTDKLKRKKSVEMLLAQC